MANNYELRKVLYNFLDIKLKQAVTLNNTNNTYVVAKVKSDSIVNIYVAISGANGAYFNALGRYSVNEFYGDKLLEVVWGGDNIIKIVKKETTDVVIVGLYLEFLKGGVEQSHLSVENNTSTTPLVSINTSNINRINYRGETLSFKSEHDVLVASLSTLNTKFQNWLNSLGSFAVVDKLIPSNAAVTGKNRRINEFIEVGAIGSELLEENTIVKGKLSDTVKVSLDKADSAIQKITVNNTVLTKNVNNEVSLLSGNTIKIRNEKDSRDEEYDVNSDGVIYINDIYEYMQPKLEGTHDDILYFNGDTLSKVKRNTFLLKDDIDKTQLSTDNDRIASSVLTESLLDTKVDKIAVTPVTTAALRKIRVNEFGQVTQTENVEAKDLTDIIKDYYLTVSYEFDTSTGVLKLL